jgi:hypothetical protein
VFETLVLVFIQGYFPPIDCTYVRFKVFTTFIVIIVISGKIGKGITGRRDAAFHHDAAAITIEHYVTGEWGSPLYNQSRSKGLGDAVGNTEDGEGAVRREGREHGGARDDEQVKDEDLYQSGEEDAQQECGEERAAKRHIGTV